MKNVIETRLVAKDELSATFKNLGGLIRGNALAADLMGRGITSAVNLAKSAVDGLANSFKDAAELQLTAASASATFAALTGKSFGEGTKFVDELNGKLSEVASKLPGTNADYKSLALGIQDNLIPAFKDLNGNVDTSAFQKDLIDITKSMTVLGVSSKTATKDVSKFTAKLLGGASEAELNNLLFAENNPAFLNLYKAEAEKRNIDLKAATVAERKELVKAVGQKLVTPELIKASSEGVSGLISGLQAQLFDQDTGIFGLMRDIDTSTKEKETVLLAINDSLSLLIGGDGLLTELTKTFESLGLTFDPMRSLRSGILKFNETIKSLRDFVRSINQIFLAPKAEKEKVDLSRIRQGIFTYIQDSITNYLSQINATEIGSNIGNLINQGINSLGKVDWTSTFKGLGSGTATLFSNLLKGGLALFETIDWLSLGNLLLAVIRGVFEGLISYIKSINYLAVVENLLTVVSGSIIGLAYLIGGTLKIVSDLYVRESTAMWNGVLNFISSKVGEFIGSLSNKFSELGQFISKKWSEVTSTATNFFDSVRNWFTDLLSKIPFVGQPNQASNQVISGNVEAGNAASGFNTKGLFEAVNRENSAKPANTSLVVANSSESILTNAQQASLIKSANSQNAGSVTIGSLTIKTEAKNAEEIADTVVSLITSKFAAYSNARLA
ncbi:MAG: hypothetical protein KME13_18470 [Myxacorys californica WJT36-NPBG1]|jgi:hypothetical protein|nr:hypothetical protein [Myxacorys californica WJT36-NPBG1]